MEMDNNIRVSFEDVKGRLKDILLNDGFSSERTIELATVFAENSLEGVPSHGLNKFAEFIRLCRDGVIDRQASAKLVSKVGALEVLDGNSGPGISNAHFGMQRAIALAKEFGVGCVALRNTNHWMRGGTYGWQAANEGCISISFTNTMPLIVPWGGIAARLGNNPLVIAVPNINGNVVLDMAMSQFAMGRVKNYQNEGKELPMDGGFDRKGKPTKNPEEIVETGRLMPIGYWKGSDLALMLDLICSSLASGNSTANIADMKTESAVSQTFICIKADQENHAYAPIINQILAFTKTSGNGDALRYPGEHIKQIRAENLKNGVLVDKRIWENLGKLY